MKGINLNQPNTVLLDTARPSQGLPYALLFQHPVDTFSATSLEEVHPLLEDLDRATNDGLYAAGFLHYEAGYAFEDWINQPSADEPLAWFGLYPAVNRVHPDCILPAADDVRSLADLEDASFSLSRTQYASAFDRIKHHIREGDVYQINYTGRITFHSRTDPVALYRMLREKQRVPYGAFIQTGERTILCLSPELFFERTGSHIETRPMKGTVHRGRTLKEDHELERWLATDEKSQAENLMIVDLLRNDLSVVAQPGSVRVPALYETERYESLIQMTSTVEAQLRPEISYVDIFDALFPSGSVTGTPKIRAMEIIRDLEPEPRGLYCGSIGYIGPADRACFNVAIRTVVLENNRGWMGSGSGIVWDSDAEQEYDECQLKSDFLTESTDSFRLIESILWENGNYHLLDYHLDRLEQSLEYFLIDLEREAIRQQLMTYAERYLGPVDRAKVRLTVDQDGHIRIEFQPRNGPGDEKLRVALASESIDSSNRFRYHKTTRRALYDRYLHRAREKNFDDVIFLNENRELTEGTISNLFLEMEGELLTPPVDAGVLPGVYRRYVLETHTNAREARLRLDHLDAAEEIYLSNAIQGLQPARIDRDVQL